MTTAESPLQRTPETAARSNELFAEHQDALHRRIDRIFAILMLLQWVAGIAAALWISPRTWFGAQSSVHIHVWAAVILGGIITILPVGLAWFQPGAALTRHSIAIGQMLTSALLIHLTGGRIETHFHVFGSLAFLAFYRDWKVLMSATVVVALDHFLRGTFWPQSVFGVLTSSPWRWIEHAGWVVFEDIFLFISIKQSLEEMHTIADRQAGMEEINRNIEALVDERTSALQAEIIERQMAQTKLIETHSQLVDASRQAGKAEVATNVLHNVGNVLNSVNVSAAVITDRLNSSKALSLAKAVDLIEKNASNPAYFTEDPKGKQLPGFLRLIVQRLDEERAIILDEVSQLKKNIDHIGDVVATQQGYAKVSGLPEKLNITDLVEDALRMNASSLARHDVKLLREFSTVPEIVTEKHKVLQILVNLIRNAKHACDDSGNADKRLTLRVANGGDRVRISIIDNGIGIRPENLTRIFNHGFTTKKDGHGFGLHSSALAAQEMGGDLKVHSEGPGKGASFTLELPCDYGETARN